MWSWFPYQTQGLKDIQETGVKERKKLSLHPRPRPWSYAGPYSFSCLCTHTMWPASPSGRTLEMRFVIGTGCRACRAVGRKRQGSLMTRRRCPGSRFCSLFIISVRTLGNRWHHSFSPLTSKQGRQHGWQSREWEYKGTNNKRIMPVYGIAFVSRHFSATAPPGIAGRCAARAMI